MRVQQWIAKEIELNIESVTLLSLEEAEKVPQNIRAFKEQWWLCSSGFIDRNAACVYGEYGYVSVGGIDVEREIGVRPALKFNLESTNLQIGSKIKVFGYNWTVISDKLILCDDIVGKSAFREDCEADYANEYESSDVKKWLENWYAEQIQSQAT